MKVTLRKDANGNYSIYVPKKDLEAHITSCEKPEIWGGKIELSNGWTLEMPALSADTRLPITIEARRLGEA